MGSPETPAQGGTAIIAFDGSSPARSAVLAAAKILGGSKVLVVTVWEEGLAYASSVGMPMGPAGEAMLSPPVDPGVAREVDHELHEHATRVAREGADLARSLGLDAEPLAVPDEEENVARTILSAADKRDAVVIVVGSRGLGGIRARLEGSTSKAILRHASRPVLVVHGEDEDKR